MIRQTLSIYPLSDFKHMWLLFRWIITIILMIMYLLHTLHCNGYHLMVIILCSQKIETMEHRMYTHTLDKSPELEKLFNLYAKKSEVSIAYVRRHLLPLYLFCRLTHK